MATCTYNGVSFEATLTCTIGSNLLSKISSKPIPNAARTTTALVEHTITVSGFLAAGTAANALTLAQMRKLLTRNGGALVYSDKGFGDLIVNVGAVRDAEFGPRTEMLEWVPLGGDGNAAKVTWQCVTRIPECDNARYELALQEIGYTVTFSIDKAGWTTERVQGRMTIPMTRESVNSTRFPDSVDRLGAYREILNRREPADGWRREDRNFTVSDDRRSLDFSWTDREQPVALPDRVADIRFDETATMSLRAGGFERNRLTFNATIEMVAGADRGEALEVFFHVIGERLFKPFGEGRALVVEEFTARESLFGTSHSFSLMAMVSAKGKRVGEFMADTLMWRPVPGTGHRQWARSVEPFGTQDVRGFAQASFDARVEDAIVDLCEPAREIAAPSERDVARHRHRRTRIIIPKKKPRPKFSWLFWHNTLTLIEDASLVPHKPLGNKPVEPAPGGQPGRGGSLRPFDTPGPSGGSGSLQDFPPGSKPGGTVAPFPSSGPLAVAPIATSQKDIVEAEGGVGFAEGQGTVFGPDIVQKAAGSSRRIVMEGEAYRLGVRIPVPKLLSVGGVQVLESGRMATEDVLSAFSVPIYYAWWQVEYIIPEAPKDALPLLASPLFDTEKGAEAG